MAKSTISADFYTFFVNLSIYPFMDGVLTFALTVGSSSGDCWGWMLQHVLEKVVLFSMIFYNFNKIFNTLSQYVFNSVLLIVSTTELASE